MRFTELNLKICTFNIEGFEKYKNDPDFIQFASSFNIFGICETWAETESDFEHCLPNYEHYVYVRQKPPRAVRNSGGVTVFVKNELVRNGIIKRIFHHFSDCVVLFVDGSKFSDINDIIRIFAFVSPEHSTVYDVQNTNSIDILSGKIFDITSAYPHAEILLAGDLNARVRDFCDFIPEDKLDYIFGENIAYPADNFNIPRKSKDCNFYNNFGLSLIEL